MASPSSETWRELNDRHIAASVGWVRAMLAAQMPQAPNLSHPADANGDSFTSTEPWPLRWLGRHPRAATQPIELTEPVEQSLLSRTSEITKAACELAEAEDALVDSGTRGTLHQLATIFRLSPFESNVLLLCLAFELDTRVAWMCGQVQDHMRCPYPTFGLAMSLFIGAEWAALPANAALRSNRLVELRQAAGTPLLAAELRLEETVLHYLRGLMSVDRRVAASCVTRPEPHRPLTDAEQGVARQLIALLAEAGRQSSAVIQLIGPDDCSKARIARTALEAHRWTLLEASLETLPPSPAEVEDLAELWRRDSLLFRLAMYVTAHTMRGPSETLRMAPLEALARRAAAPLIVAAAEPFELHAREPRCIEVPAPTTREQRVLWSRLLPPTFDQVDRLAGELAWQFQVNREIAEEAVTQVSKVATHQCPRTAIWEFCRVRSRPRVDGLAHRIDAKATWGDLIVSEDRLALLERLAAQVRTRWRVYDDWGMADGSNRGLGISALFAGESGTGKTMAAEVLANALQLDLYRVDLSSVVNKYIGETEKHLRRVFDAFESCGAILFFDECDALFGKRTDVRDSHDRYANIEVNYLLQRLESYRGVAILATNNRSAVDAAFLRRLRFVVMFTMPNASERKRMWQRLLPRDCQGEGKTQLPVGPLRYDRLAQLQLSGGSIQNIALNAAFRAAERGEHARIEMGDILAAARDEHIKLERPINEADFQYLEPAIEEAAA